MWFLALLISAASAADSVSCPTKGKIPQNWNASTINQFLLINKNTVDDPAELICCMARDTNVEIAVAHSSIAAQDSDPDHPRILVINRTPDGEIKGIMSINSTAAHLNQTSAVEFMFNDSKSKKTEFYDIDFSSGKSHMSGKNPQSCMACHSNQVPNDESPRALFDIFPWPRFVSQTQLSDGENSFSFLPLAGNQCKNTDAIRKTFEDRSRLALNSNPRYACVKDKPLADLDGIDQSLNDLNNLRIIQRLRKTKDYDKFKYAMAAEELCEFRETVLPSKAIAGITNTKFISPEVAKLKTPQELSDYMNRVRERNRVASMELDKKHAEQLKILNSGGTVKSLDYPDINRVGTCELPQNQDLKPLLIGASLLENQYIADSFGKGDLGMGFYRFLFEGRGIDISNWDRQAVTGYSRSPFNLWLAIAKEEPINSELHKLIYQPAIDAKKDIFVQKKIQDPAQKWSICQNLKRLSYSAFGEKYEIQPMPPEASPEQFDQETEIEE